MKDTSLAIFQDRPQAEAAISELTDKGYDAKDISVVVKDNVVRSNLKHSTGANVAGGTLTGAVAGGAIGILTGLLIGVGAISIPGLGAVLIGGPLAASLGLAGATAIAAEGAVTGALAGGLLGVLVGLGIPAREAKIYEERIKEGAILVAVAGHAEEVEKIFRHHGATQITRL